MKLEEIKTIAVIGAGNMGHQIAALCALKGYRTFCMDADKKALDKAIDYLNTIGSETIEKRNLMLAGYLFDELVSIGKKMYTPDTPKSPIVSYFEDDPLPLAAKLKRMKIKVTGREAHGGHMRISGHFYNTKEDINKLLRALS